VEPPPGFEPGTSAGYRLRVSERVPAICSPPLYRA